MSKYCSTRTKTILKLVTIEFHMQPRLQPHSMSYGAGARLCASAVYIRLLPIANGSTFSRELKQWSFDCDLQHVKYNFFVPKIK